MVLERDASARLLKRERDIRDALLSNLLPKPIVRNCLPCSPKKWLICSHAAQIARLETLAQNADGLQRANSSSATSEQSMSGITLGASEAPQRVFPAVLFDQILSPAPDMHDSDNSVTIADEFDNVTLVFVDFAGFTTFCADRTPIEVVRFLNAIYYALDKAAAKHGLMKIKTIGDCYLAMGGGLRTSQELEPRENAGSFGQLQRCSCLTVRPRSQHAALWPGVDRRCAGLWHSRARGRGQRASGGRHRRHAAHPVRRVGRHRQHGVAHGVARRDRTRAGQRRHAAPAGRQQRVCV